MKSIDVLLAVLANGWVVSAVLWKDSISRNTTDILRKRYRDEKTQKFSTVFNSRKPSLTSNPASKPFYITLPLDHFTTSNTDTFQSRYYVQDSYYQPGGPVIFHDIGESSIERYAPGLVDEEEFTVSMAKRFNGLLILFEHRFYGESAPLTEVSRALGDASKEGLTAFFKYLTIEQALEDVVVFANNFTYDFQSYPSQKLTPEYTPWVYVGVSYSGARGAWLAKRNPGLFKATLASSAPVELKVDFWEYFVAIEANLAASGNTNCSADLAAAAAWLSQAWETQNETLVDKLIDTVYQADWENYISQFRNQDDPRIWDTRRDYMQDAAWTAFADFQYYGVQGGTLGKFCDIMETAYSDNAPAEGLFATESLDRAVAGYTKAVAAINPYSYSRSARNKAKLKQKRQSSKLDSSLDDYAWLWQVCSEFGAFQVANTSRPQNMLPSFINVAAQIDQCIGTFGESDQVSLAGPNVSPINQKYLGWNIELSNTLWTNGEFDPWRALSIDSTTEDAPTNDTSTTEIPQCGTTFPRGTQLRYVIVDGYHGSEFSEDVVENADDIGLNPTNTIGGISASRRVTLTSTGTGTPVADARNAQSLWFNAMSTWLPCGTQVFTFTSPQPSSSTPFKTRSSYSTDGPSTDGSTTEGLTTDGSTTSNPSRQSSSPSENKTQSAASLVLPPLMNLFMLSLFAFLTGVGFIL
ncbi:hypothetical protein H072_8275 [Dactylellina haptotyla CBS 200.50]|uniref:Uncharacterized protein n=1 Tax=Dactylellina haptotyla (strain CBS 200.50) TaxID=1284197 RepID=S8AA94_DACHA|nr:hypothetical protein H072_8275 [Dactylellina haptotyla CBS 200.50]